jgi:16S rRNA C1402 N4-methylase RsmH
VGHVSVLLDEILGFVPSSVKEGCLLDVTAGGGGHFFAILKAHPLWKGECWDRDPDAVLRIQQKGVDFEGRYQFLSKEFSKEASPENNFDFILIKIFNGENSILSVRAIIWIFNKTDYIVKRWL